MPQPVEMSPRCTSVFFAAARSAGVSGVICADGEGVVSEADFLAKVPEIAVLAIGDACTGSNPRIPTPEEMEKLLKCCYYDTEVDF